MSFTDAMNHAMLTNPVLNPMGFCQHALSPNSDPNALDSPIVKYVIDKNREAEETKQANGVNGTTVAVSGAVGAGLGSLGVVRFVKANLAYKATLATEEGAKNVLKQQFKNLPNEAFEEMWKGIKDKTLSGAKTALSEAEALAKKCKTKWMLIGATALGLIGAGLGVKLGKTDNKTQNA